VNFCELPGTVTVVGASDVVVVVSGGELVVVGWVVGGGIDGEVVVVETRSVVEVDVARPVAAEQDASEPAASTREPRAA